MLVASRRDVELVYTSRAVLAYFHRPEPRAPSVVSEVTPIPTGLYQMLPRDLRAGTGAPISRARPTCWMVPVGELSCRTCCVTIKACTVNCKGAPTPRESPGTR